MTRSYDMANKKLSSFLVVVVLGFFLRFSAILYKQIALIKIQAARNEKLFQQVYKKTDVLYWLAKPCIIVD